MKPVGKYPRLNGLDLPIRQYDGQAQTLESDRPNASVSVGPPLWKSVAPALSLARAECLADVGRSLRRGLALPGSCQASQHQRSAVAP